MSLTSPPAIALIVALVLVGYLVVSAWLYRLLTRVPQDVSAWMTPNTPAAFTIDGLDCEPYAIAAFEAVEFPDRTGSVGIAGWWIPAAGNPRARAVVMVHGYTASRHDPWVLLAAGMLHRHGFSCLVIDLRNHGDSGRTSGRHSGGIRESGDVLGAWDWLVRERRLPPSAIGLFGISLGAASVVIAAGDEPGVAAVWSDSGYGDLADATRAELGRNHLPGFLLPGGHLAARILDGPGLRDKSPALAMAQLGGRAVFITHGTRDSRLDVRYADQLIEAGRAAGARIDSWVVDGSEHAGAIVDQPDEYERRLVGFFDGALRSD